MKTESNIKPSKYTVEQHENLAEIILCENIEQDDEPTVFTYDEYRIITPWRDNLKQSVKSAFESWLTRAKQAEYDEYADRVRLERNERLTATDWTAVEDSPLSDTEKAAWRAYRQALRDVTEQPGFPYEINWPEKPE